MVSVRRVDNRDRSSLSRYSAIGEYKEYMTVSQRSCVEVFGESASLVWSLSSLRKTGELEAVSRHRHVVANDLQHPHHGSDYPERRESQLHHLPQRPRSIRGLGPHGWALHRGGAEGSGKRT